MVFYDTPPKVTKAHRVAGNPYSKGRLSRVELLIKISCCKNGKI
jgi:hypothetical protein